MLLKFWGLSGRRSSSSSLGRAVGSAAAAGLGPSTCHVSWGKPWETLLLPLVSARCGGGWELSCSTPSSPVLSSPGLSPRSTSHQRIPGCPTECRNRETTPPNDPCSARGTTLGGSGDVRSIGPHTSQASLPSLPTLCKRSLELEDNEHFLLAVRR